MKAKNFVMASMLVVVMGLVAGCHYGSYDSGHGYGSSSGSYRDGRTYDSRHDGGGYSPYDSHSYYRR